MELVLTGMVVPGALWWPHSAGCCFARDCRPLSVHWGSEKGCASQTHTHPWVGAERGIHMGDVSAHQLWAPLTDL